MPSFRPLLPSLTAFLLASCTAFIEPQFATLAHQPLSAEPRVHSVESWSYSDRTGQLIHTRHYQIYTTMNDPLFQHLLVRVLEAAYDRQSALIGTQIATPFNCYVFSSRPQWETYTRAHAGVYADTYLQILSGGYCQTGVFAGYDIGRDRTLSVIAHEAWHQYSWFAFKDRLPSWLEEGLAAQNEAIVWDAQTPTFQPQTNTSRMAALRKARSGGTLWPLADLLPTHAGQVIKMSQPKIDAYYAELWSLVLFLQRSPIYAPRLTTLLSDAAAGKLVSALDGTTITRDQIDNYTERWNTLAGPIYFQKYLNSDIPALEREYRAWLRDFIREG